MRYIVTGGAGFIGSHLVARLLADGHEVSVIDNFSTGRPQNLERHRDNPKLAVHQADVREPEPLAAIIKDADAVFHLAALADIVPSVVDPALYYDVNVCGTMRVAEAARRSGVKKLVYAASSSCYGIPDIYPTPETEEIRPQYPYALTKLLGEQTMLHWGKVYGMPVLSLRLFNVYGPRARTSGTYGAVFGVFLAQKLAGKPFTIVGDGSQTRDFVHASDIAEAFYAAARSPLRHAVMNVGSGASISINTIADLLGGEKTYIPRRPGEPERTFADISKIRRLLNWSPKVGIEEGVKDMLANIDYWKQAPLWTPESIAEATRDWFKYLSPKQPA
ncbi:MAG: SDR family oxidoreductase [Elusimicrobiales bacterium]